MYSWKERIADWWHRTTEGLELTKAAWVQICVAVGLAALVFGIIIGISIPGIRADIARQADELASNLTAMAGQGQAARDELEASIADELSDLWNALDTNLTEFGRRMADMGTDWDELQALLGSLNRTESSAYLAGTFGNYTLHVKSLTGGNFTANVHLAYAPAVGNATSYADALGWFHSGINWTVLGVPSYICGVTFNGTAWGISEVGFNVGIIPLVADEWAEFNITCAGLNSTWEPSFGYAEVHRI